MGENDMINVSDKKSVFTVKNVLRAVAVLGIIFVFCPSFLVSCSGQEVNVNVMTAVGGVSAYGEKVVDPHPVMLICLLIPIVILTLTILKKLTEKKTAGILLACTAGDFIVWLIFRASVKKVAEDNYCGFKTTAWYVINMIVLLLGMVLSLLMCLGKMKIDTDLLTFVTGDGRQDAINQMSAAVSQMSSAVTHLAGNAISGRQTKGTKENAMGFCSKCGSPIEYGCKFCISCGTPVPESMIKEAEEARKAAEEKARLEAESARKAAEEKAGLEAEAVVTAQTAQEDRPMFCQNCGAKLETDAVFCKACGKPLGKGTEQSEKGLMPHIDGMSGNGAESVKTKNTSNRLAEQLKVIPKKFVIGVCAAVALIIAVICIAVNTGSTINLNKYLIVESNGYDGYGTAQISVDWNAITEQYGKKISFTSQAQNEYGGLIKMMTPIDVLQDCISVRLEESNGLKNGQEVSYRWEVDAKLSELLKCKVKYENDSYRVSGLTEVGTFDAFADLQVEFSGTAPNGNANFNYTGSELSVYDFSYDKASGLSNGDTVIVSIDENRLPYYIESMGKIPEKLEQEYQVEGLSSYIAQISEINEAGLSAMKQQASDVYSAYVAQRWDNSQERLESFTYIGNYLLTPKNNDTYRGNMLYMVFKAQVRNDYTYEGERYNKLNDIYWYICFEDVMADPEGNPTINITNYRTPFETFTVESGIGGWWTKRWSYEGYQTLDELYRTVVLSNMDTYNHEDNVDEGAASQTVEAQEEEPETLTADGYILSNSDKELLTKAELEGLSAEECKIARNEIYARHGRRFKDEGLQAHFDSCNWYDGRIEPDDFQESELSEIEIANKDLIVAYEKEKGYQ